VWLVVCEPQDEPALWAAAGLRHLGVAPLEVVLPAELGVDSRLVHHVDGEGGTSLEVELRSGVTIRGDEVGGVLNRMLSVPPPEALQPSDRDYVAEELGAAVAAWFAALPCPVLNRPTPTLLCGPWRPPAHWRWLAAQVGLAALPWRLASWDEPDFPEPFERRHVLVVGDEVTGPVPNRLDEGCVALAQAGDATLLGVTFARDESGQWRVEDATPLPDFRCGSAAGLDALRRALRA
jgi:hypothetical protein